MKHTVVSVASVTSPDPHGGQITKRCAHSVAVAELQMSLPNGINQPMWKATTQQRPMAGSESALQSDGRRPARNAGAAAASYIVTCPKVSGFTPLQNRARHPPAGRRILGSVSRSR